MTYSTADEIERFIDARVAEASPRRKPLFVLDMDGNILIGYNLKSGQILPECEDSARRNIPKGSDIAALTAQGVIEPALFADKPMDSRLPPALVERLNALQQAGDAFQIAILTSRSEADALEMLRESGVRHPEQHTLVADSGAVLRCLGKRQPVRSLDVAEQQFLDGLPQQQAQMEAAVDACLTAMNLPVAERPPLRFEQKGIACNVHFREVLSHFDMAEDSALAQALSGVVQAELQAYVAAHSPLKDNAPAFKLLHGPATLEVKLADVHKGHGLQAVVDAALKNGVRPSSVIFAGDDICTRDAGGTASPGTDYYAFAAAQAVAAKTGIPVYGIHTLHPADGTLHGTTPDASKTPPADMATADITVSSPLVLGDVVEKTLARYAAIDKRARSGAAQSFSAGSPAR